jgi:hypothetical protein
MKRHFNFLFCRLFAVEVQLPEKFYLSAISDAVFGGQYVQCG